MTTEEICEALVRHVETSGSEAFNKNLVSKDGRIIATVWCVLGDNAHLFHDLADGNLTALGFERD